MHCYSFTFLQVIRQTKGQDIMRMVSQCPQDTTYLTMVCQCGFDLCFTHRSNRSTHEIKSNNFSFCNLQDGRIILCTTTWVVRNANTGTKHNQQKNKKSFMNNNDLMPREQWVSSFNNQLWQSAGCPSI